MANLDGTPSPSIHQEGAPLTLACCQLMSLFCGECSLNVCLVWFGWGGTPNNVHPVCGQCARPVAVTTCIVHGLKCYPMVATALFKQISSLG